MVLGHISDYLRVDFKDVVNSGPALAFVSYPFAIAKAFGPSPVGWVVAIIVSMLFFLMLFCVGIGSVATITDSIVANIHKNLFPKIWLWLLKAIVCFFLFIGGIFYTTPVSFLTIRFFNMNLFLFSGIRQYYSFHSFEIFRLMSVWLWNFKDGGSYNASFLPKNPHAQRKPLYFENTGSISSSKIGHDFRK